MQRDTAGLYRFAALQSKPGQQLLIRWVSCYISWYYFKQLFRFFEPHVLLAGTNNVGP